MGSDIKKHFYRVVRAKGDFSKALFRLIKDDGAGMRYGELSFTGFWNMPAKCGVGIGMHGDSVTIVFTELPENTGTSVTNISDELAMFVHNELLPEGVAPGNITWYEHYPVRQDGDDGTGGYGPGDFSIISYDHTNIEGLHIYSNPRWKYAPQNNDPV